MRIIKSDSLIAQPGEREIEYTEAESAVLDQFFSFLFELHAGDVRKGGAQGGGFRGDDKLLIELWRSNPVKGELGYPEKHCMYNVLPVTQ